MDDAGAGTWNDGKSERGAGGAIATGPAVNFRLQYPFDGKPLMTLTP